MKAGVTTSVIAHAAFLVLALVGLGAAKPLEPEVVESIAVELVPISEVTNIRMGSLDSTVVETETPAVVETETPAETSTPTITPTPPLPPDVVAVALVNLPEGIGGRLRDAPNGNVIGGVPGNTEVHVLDGRETTPDGIAWVRIRIPDTGQTGWFAEDLLIYQDEPGG